MYDYINYMIIFINVLWNLNNILIFNNLFYLNNRRQQNLSFLLYAESLKNVGDYGPP